MDILTKVSVYCYGKMFILAAIQLAENYIRPTEMGLIDFFIHHIQLLLLYWMMAIVSIDKPLAHHKCFSTMPCNIMLHMLCRMIVLQLHSTMILITQISINDISLHDKPCHLSCTCPQTIIEDGLNYRWPY